MYQLSCLRPKSVLTGVGIGVLMIFMFGLNACAMTSTRSESQDRSAADSPKTKDNRPYLNVQGTEFLAKFDAPALPVRVKAGETIYLWDVMTVFEDPDFDPVQYLDQIEVAWNQVSGPKVSIEESKTRAAAVHIPIVIAPAKIELRCSLLNSSGKKTLTLILQVFP